MTLTDDELFALAPPSLTSYRSLRYHADDRSVLLGSFPAAEQAPIAALYELMREVMELTRSTFEPATSVATAPDDPRAALEAVLRRNDSATLFEHVRRLGRDVAVGTLMADAVHDVRGGALSALCVELQLALRPTPRKNAWRSLFLMARDHAKVMRSVVADLDPERRQLDLAPRAHTTADLAVALRAFSAEIDGQPARIEVDCRTDLPIAETCVEFGAVDRAIYNLLNNAVRHASSPLIRVWILPVGENVRFVVANSISAETEASLRPLLLDGALPTGYTSTGSGIGLAVVAGLVGSAYGIGDAREVKGGGYYGVALFPGSFVTWFHWPRVHA